MSKHIINQDFLSAINRLRKILPTLSFGLLIGTYLISAIIMGIFHAQKAENIGFVIAAYLVPLAIQMGRGTLVFFFQLNPARIQNRLSMGVIAASVLLVFSLLEAYLVLSPYGYSWIISVCTLMVIGWVIEIMILKETVFATQVELYNNPTALEELKAFYRTRSEVMDFIDGKIPLDSPTPNEAPIEKSKESKAFQLLEELNQHLGKVERPLELTKQSNLNGHQH
ncbi:MAG: hypothetical protein AAFO82_01610 [Bacteroidota bacterium]